ncbi:zinc finger protein 853-like isoform X2 [Hyperolius riggenbachi]|uniref:zinc finger protein 853-like isoform X2 n=1 Tax=Hyperolius riggenbachi TaxID=752182 RepID=UPI0035A30439
METVEYFTVEDLMMTVQAHPALYDKANPDHKNLVETRRLWEGIARRYCQGYDSLPNKQKTREVDKYKTKWRSVRDNYIKDLKAEIKEKRSGRGASRRTPYRYSNLLGFLRPILQPRLAEDSLQEEEEGSVEPREPSPRRPIKSESIEEVSVGTPSTSYLEDPPSPRASSPLPPESTESCQAFTQRSRRLAAPLANKEAEPPTEGAMTGIYGLIKSQEQLVSRHIQEESQTALIEKYQKHIESLQNQLDTIHNHYWQQLQQQHNQMKEQLQEQRLQSKEQNKHLKDQIEQQQLILQRYETQLQQLQSSPSYFTVMALLPFLDQVPQHRLLECQFSLLEVVRGLITPAEEPPAIQPEQQTFQGWHQQYHG